MIDQLDDMDTSSPRTAELPHPDFDNMTADTDELATLIHQAQTGINLLKMQRAYAEGEEPDSLQSGLSALSDRFADLYRIPDADKSAIRGEMEAIRGELRQLTAQLEWLQEGLI